MEIRKQTTYHSALGDTRVVEVERHVLSPSERHNMRVNGLIQAVSAVVAFINALLLLRILFTLFGATATGFAASLYTITDPFVRPFQVSFPAVAGTSLDVAAIVAMIVIALIGWGIASLIGLFYRPIESEL